MRSFILIILAFALVPACKSNTDAGKTAVASRTVGLHGRILETIGAPPYVYLHLKTDTGDTWAAVPASPVKVGDEVTVQNPQKMDGFTSKTLNRTFKKIVFGTLAQAGGSAGAKAAMLAMHPQAKPAANVGPIEVAKVGGPNGYTVAELFAKKDALAEKTATVRGEVVKVNNNIMGTNWIHLRDGSGTAAKADNDLTVTSKDTAAIGDVVVATGTVKKDQNVGAGYKYPVMIRKASLKVEHQAKATARADPKAAK